MEILIPEERIRQRIPELARKIARDYEGQPVTIIGVLTGSLMFVADLVRHLDLSLQIGFIKAKSYRGETTEAGTLDFSADLLPAVEGRHVLLLDDILDSGQTLSCLCECLKERGVASLRTGVLLRKIGRQRIPCEPDYIGFEIPDAFVVGYGLDYNDEFRHLPYIAVLSEKSPLLRRAPQG